MSRTWFIPAALVAVILCFLAGNYYWIDSPVETAHIANQPNPVSESHSALLQKSEQAEELLQPISQQTELEHHAETQQKHEESHEHAAFDANDNWLGLSGAKIEHNAAGYPEISGEYSRAELHPAYHKDDRLSFSLPGITTLSGRVMMVHSSEQHATLGIALDKHDGVVHLEFNAQRDIERGFITSSVSELIYFIEPEVNNKIRLRAAPQSELIPDERGYLPEESDVPAMEPIVAGAITEATDDTVFAASVPIFDSNPGAPGVILLDFDGHTTSGTIWNSNFNGGQPIVSPAPPLTDAQIIETCKRVAEDFSPFTITVTTSEAVYQAAAQNQRIRVVISPYWEWYGSAGGVAYYHSWSWSGDTPVFVFSSKLSNSPRFIAEASSHEVGHSVGLMHDGCGVDNVAYYRGHGTWAPIMGVGYYKTVTQWSKGEYFNANNTQDDLAIMRNYAGIDYRSDLHGNSIGEAADLGVTGSSISDSGIIETSSDVDFFGFDTGAGSITLAIVAASPGGNLNIKATLYTAAGAVVATSDSTSTINATISSPSISGGRYYLAVEGTGELDPLETGYSAYGSIGQYTITGTIVEPGDGDPEPTPTVTPTASPTATPQPTPSPTATPDPTPQPDPTGTPTATPQPSATPEPSVSPTSSPSATPEPTATPPVSDYINFNEHILSRYAGKRYSKQYSDTVIESGYGITLAGSTWQKIDFPLAINRNTVIEFEVAVDVAGKLHAIGIEEDVRPDAERFFQLAGTKIWGIQDFNSQCSDSCPEWRSVKIPVGLFYQSETAYIVFVNEVDNTNGAPVSSFRNIHIYDESQSGGGVKVTEQVLSSYGGALQDIASEHAIYDGGDTLLLRGNGWKKILFPYEITPATMLSLTFAHSGSAEIQGIGFDDNSILSPERLFQFAGEQIFGVQDFRGASGVVHIPVGQYYTGLMRYVIFANDDDRAGATTGAATFQSIQLYEAGALNGADSEALRCNLALRKRKKRRFIARIEVDSQLTGKGYPYTLETSEDMGETWNVAAEDVVTDRVRFRKKFIVANFAQKVFRLNIADGTCISKEFFFQQYDANIQKRSKRRVKKLRARWLRSPDNSH